MNNQKVDVTDYVKTVQLTLAKGNAYNLVLNLGNPGDEIMFTCTEVDGWGNGNTADDATDNDSNSTTLK